MAIRGGQLIYKRMRCDESNESVQLDEVNLMIWDMIKGAEGAETHANGSETNYKTSLTKYNTLNSLITVSEKLPIGDS